MVNRRMADLDLVFSALSDPTRRRIVERLARGRLSVGQIASEFPISQPAISKHVRILEDAGLLERTIDGRVHYCDISPAAMEAVSSWIDRQRTYWNAALDRLDAMLNAQNKKGKRS